MYFLVESIFKCTLPPQRQSSERGDINCSSAILILAGFGSCWWPFS